MALFVKCPRTAQKLWRQFPLLAKLDTSLLQLPRDCLTMAFKLSSQFERRSAGLIQRHQLGSFDHTEFAHLTILFWFPFAYLW